MKPPSAKPWFFDTWSRFYDAEIVQRLVYRPVHDAVLEVLARRRPKTALDLGCGTGLLALRLKRELLVENVIGADFSAGMLEQASQHRRDIAWVRASASALPFADGTFEVIASTEAFHWFPDQALALRECRRVLAPGGMLVVALVQPWSDWLSSALYGASTLAGQPGYWPTRECMHGILEDAGFVVESHQHVARLGGLPLFPAAMTVAVRR